MFRYRLAGYLKMTVSQLEDTMTGDEFAGWLALYETEPWDGTRGEVQQAIIGAALLNAQCGKVVAQPRELLPKFGQEKPKAMTRAEWQAYAESYNARRPKGSDERQQPR